jgi:hypothetical protein
MCYNVNSTGCSNVNSSFYIFNTTDGNKIISGITISQLFLK